MTRSFFSDGWNSFWHAAFGVLASQAKVVGWVFVAYQVGQGGANTATDLGEFFVGLLAGLYALPLILG